MQVPPVCCNPVLPNLALPEREGRGLGTSAPTLGQRVRAAREAKGWSRQTLAAKSGVSVTTLCEIELYGRTPRTATLELVAKPLGLRVELVNA